jgi:hypothetical protein
MNEFERKNLEQEWVDAGASFGISPEDMVKSMNIFIESREILLERVQLLSDNCYGNICMIGIASMIAQALFLAELPDQKYIAEAVENLQAIVMKAFNENSSASEQFSAMITLNMGNKGGND